MTQVAAKVGVKESASPRSPSPGSPPRHRLLKRVTCPHCWARFTPEQALWISRHTELLGDHVLGPEAPSRFPATRFTLEGQAIDARGVPCHTLACPTCHLSLPRDLIEFEPLFVSIIGVPSSGKSYYLASLTWELRRLLPSKFAISFSDADTVSNRSLNDYEETLFLAGDRTQLVAIRKTELQGELYDQITLGQQLTTLPRPFMFSLRPTTKHPRHADPDISRVMCVYDNAGEHFQPGMDTQNAPVTQHLAKSRVLMFVFDPTQDARFRQQCTGFSQDPQLGSTRRAQRQETILHEAAQRVRRYTGLASTQKIDRALLILVNKSDVWAPLIPTVDVVTEPIIDENGQCMVDLSRIEATSEAVRELMEIHAPEFTAAAREFCDHVIYIPVSSFGRAPEIDPETQILGIRPQDIAPRWVTVPVLYALAKWTGGTVPGARRPVAKPPQAS